MTHSHSTLFTPLRRSLALGLSLGLSLGACSNGEPIQSEQGAAEAAYRIMKTNDEVRSQQASGLRGSQAGDFGDLGDLDPDDFEGGSGTGNGNVAIGPDGVSASLEWTVQGAEGSALVKTSANVGTGSVEAEYSITYDGFSSEGSNTLDGNVTHRVQVAGDQNSAQVVAEVKGTVTVAGEIEAQLELDVRLAVSASANSAEVSITGSVIADGTSFEFDGETLDLEGSLEAF